MNLLACIHSEYIKGKHTFSRRILILFPLISVSMAVALMGGQFTQIGAYNWWYMLFLPTVMSLFCGTLIQVDKKLAYFNINTLPIQKGKIWMAKILTGCGYLFVANGLIFILPTLSGLIFGEQFPIWKGLLASTVLTLTWLWQIPLAMFLTATFNSTTTFLTILILNFVCSIQDIAGGKLWMIPFAIPARLMAPIIRVNPNGIPLELGSPLGNTNVILLGIGITLILFFIGFGLTTLWFNQKEVVR